MNKPQIKADKISIISIRILSGNISCSDEAANNHPVIEGCDTEISITHRFNAEMKQFLFLLQVNLNAKDQSNELIGITAEYKIEFIIQVDNLEEYKVDNEDGSHSYHPMLGGTLVSIVYSTARGIIISRTQGTLLEGVILPVIDPIKLLDSKIIHTV